MQLVYLVGKRIAMRDLEEKPEKAVIEILDHRVREFQNDERVNVRIFK